MWRNILEYSHLQISNLMWWGYEQYLCIQVKQCPTFTYTNISFESVWQYTTVRHIDICTDCDALDIRISEFRTNIILLFLSQIYFRYTT
jgi:hypothetical protein